jgi:hypothetical protein
MMYASPVKNLADLYNHRVYIFQREKFFGYVADPSLPISQWKLVEFAQNQVRDKVMETLGITQDFLQSEINDETTLLIVPDSWDRTLPKAASQFNGRLMYLPFSYILHPSVANPSDMLQLKAPLDAEYQIMLAKQHDVAKVATFKLADVPEDVIMARFKGWIFGRKDPDVPSVNPLLNWSPASVAPPFQTRASSFVAPTPSMDALSNFGKTSAQSSVSNVTNQLASGGKFSATDLGTQAKNQALSSGRDAANKLIPGQQQQTAAAIASNQLASGGKFSATDLGTQAKNQALSSSRDAMNKLTSGQQSQQATKGAWDAFMAQTPGMAPVKKTSVKKQVPVLKSSAYVGHAKKMSVEPEEDNATESAEYKEAWNKLVARATKMQAKKGSKKKAHSKMGGHNESMGEWSADE